MIRNRRICSTRVLNSCIWRFMMRRRSRKKCPVLPIRRRSAWWARRRRWIRRRSNRRWSKCTPRTWTATTAVRSGRLRRRSSRFPPWLATPPPTRSGRGAGRGSMVPMAAWTFRWVRRSSRWMPVCRRSSRISPLRWRQGRRRRWRASRRWMVRLHPRLRRREVGPEARGIKRSSTLKL